MWSISYYEYGWLVYPASLYVLFRQRDELASIRPQKSTLGILLAAVLVLAWLVARVAGIQVIEFISATLLVFAVFWAIAGTKAMRKTAFPLLLLLAAVPVSEFLVEPLMRITAKISEVLLALIAVPALRDGQFFYLPGGSFEVADVCSGLKYLLAGVFAGLAFSYVTYTSVYKRLLFIGIVGIAVVVTNGVRAFIVMSVASATRMKILGGEDHIIFGMVMFAVVFVALIWVGEKYADPQADTKPPVGAGSANSEGAVILGAAILPVLILMAGPPLFAITQNRAAAALTDIPLPSLSGCEKHVGVGNEGDPVFVNADLEKRQVYFCGKSSISVYMASYGIQRQGKELISWENRLWPRAWARYVDQTTISTRFGSRSIDIQQVLVRHPRGLRLIRYWYQVGSSVTSSQIEVKLLETLRVLTLQPFESSVIAVSIRGNVTDDFSALEKQLDRHTDQVMNWNLQRAGAGASR
jgi:EpsI family protein